MKKIILALLLCSSIALCKPLEPLGHTCIKAISTRQYSAISSFCKNPIKYYKRWAVAYCLGYSSDEAKIESNGCYGKERKEIPYMWHIDNMVMLGGDEPLDEIKNLIDKYDNYRSSGAVNGCFDRFYDDIFFQEKLEEIVKKYHINCDCIRVNKCE